MINEYMYTIWNNFAMNLDTNTNLLTEKGWKILVGQTDFSGAKVFLRIHLSSPNAFVRLG